MPYYNCLSPSLQCKYSQPVTLPIWFTVRKVATAHPELNIQVVEADTNQIIARLIIFTNFYDYKEV